MLLTFIGPKGTDGSSPVRDRTVSSSQKAAWAGSPTGALCRVQMWLPAWLSASLHVCLSEARWKAEGLALLPYTFASVMSLLDSFACLYLC